MPVLGGVGATDAPTYRHTLIRRPLSELIHPRLVALWVCLNPSTATADKDDPSVRRMVDFSRRWLVTEMWLGNLFAARSTDPNQLLTMADPVGAANDAAIQSMARKADVVICGWGRHKAARLLNDRARHVTALLRATVRAGVEIQCLGHNQDGSPWHPLYIPAATRPVPFRG